MLVEFRVKNFRSLRDEQVLSLVASRDKTLQDTHTQATGINAAPALLRSAVVYGANASGKVQPHQSTAIHAWRGG
jgi:AAA15 family ATPase/GTPase